MADQIPDSPEYEPLSRTQVLIAMGVTAVVLLLASKLWMRFGNAVPLPVRWSPLDLSMGIALGLGISLASSVVYYLWGAYRQSADYYLELVLKPLAWADLIWLGLLPGLSEELLFRGVMLPFFGLDTEGLVISSICFGVLHLSNPKQWAYVVWATVIGLVLGASAIYTDNLLIPIAAHITTNLTSSILWKWGEHRRANSKT